MNNKTLLDRPALTAIAAALALASAPAWAQETPSADAPSGAVAVAPATTAPAPVVTPQSPLDSAAPALPPIAMPSPAPQAAPIAAVTPQHPETEAQPPARVERTRQIVARTAPVERAERTPAPVRPFSATPITVAPATPPTAQPDQSPLLQAPMMTPSDLRAMQQRQAEAQVAPTPAPTPAIAAPQQDNIVYWVVGTGGAALVLAFGALVFLRPRGRKPDARDAAPTPETVTWPDPAAVKSLPAAQKARRSAAHAAPRASARTSDAHSSELEAMVAQKPSAANPFVTRAQRLRRANFILNNANPTLNNDGHAPANHVPAPTPVEEVTAAVVATPSKEHQKKPVFSYEAKLVAIPSTGWKPATT